MFSTRKLLIVSALCGLSGFALAAGTPSAAPAAKNATPATTAAAPAATTPAPSAGASMSAADKTSYSIGIDIGRNLKAQGLSIELKSFSQGIQDGTTGQAALTDQEIHDELTRLQKDLLEKRATELKKVATENKTKGDAFLAANKKKKGVITLPSGLQYRVITEGSGTVPAATDVIVAHYLGKFIDGTEFDSSYAHNNQPVTFPVNGVIPGWSEALQKMKVGSKWELVIPPELAYKEMGAGGKIGPNATLVFELELLSIQAPEAPKVAETAPAATPAKADAKTVK